jgi:hypothetical protein
MENQNTNQQFKEDEIAYIRRWDKELNDYISIPYPKIGGRLRLAHEDNEVLSIETEIVRYDEQIAVVSAVSTTAKGCFKGIGMASIQRDEKIAPAILELAETRAIARALRFAGYGVEYCSAEEVSHLGNGNGGNGHYTQPNQNDNLPACGNRNSGNGNDVPTGGDRNGGNGSSPYRIKSNGNGNGDSRPHRSDGNGNGGNGNGGIGNGRLTSKQYKYILKLNQEQGRSSADLDNQCLERYGTVAQYLSKGDASTVIKQLMAG